MGNAQIFHGGGRNTLFVVAEKAVLGERLPPEQRAVISANRVANKIMGVAGVVEIQAQFTVGGRNVEKYVSIVDPADDDEKEVRLSYALMKVAPLLPGQEFEATVYATVTPNIAITIAYPSIQSNAVRTLLHDGDVFRVVDPIGRYRITSLAAYGTQASVQTVEEMVKHWRAELVLPYLRKIILHMTHALMTLHAMGYYLRNLHLGDIASLNTFPPLRWTYFWGAQNFVGVPGPNFVLMTMKNADNGEIFYGSSSCFLELPPESVLLKKKNGEVEEDVKMFYHQPYMLGSLALQILISAFPSFYDHLHERVHLLKSFFKDTLFHFAEETDYYNRQACYREVGSVVDYIAFYGTTAILPLISGKEKTSLPFKIKKVIEEIGVQAPSIFEQIKNGVFAVWAAHLQIDEDIVTYITKRMDPIPENRISANGTERWIPFAQTFMEPMLQQTRGDPYSTLRFSINMETVEHQANVIIPSWEELYGNIHGDGGIDVETLEQILPAM